MQTLKEILALTIQVQLFTKSERTIVVSQFTFAGSVSGFPIHCHPMTEEKTSASLPSGSKKFLQEGNQDFSGFFFQENTPRMEGHQVYYVVDLTRKQLWPLEVT